MRKVGLAVLSITMAIMAVMWVRSVIGLKAPAESSKRLAGQIIRVPRLDHDLEDGVAWLALCEALKRHGAVIDERQDAHPDLLVAGNAYWHQARGGGYDGIILFLMFYGPPGSALMHNIEVRQNFYPPLKTAKEREGSTREVARRAVQELIAQRAAKNGAPAPSPPSP